MLFFGSTFQFLHMQRQHKKHTTFKQQLLFVIAPLFMAKAIKKAKVQYLLEVFVLCPNSFFYIFL